MADPVPDANSSLETADDAAVAREALGQIASLWWIPLFRGVMLIVLGGYALLTPGVTLVAYTWVLGLFVLLDGIVAILAGALGWVPSRVWTLIRGVIGVVAGLFVVAYPALVGLVAVTTLIVILAVQCIVGGVLEIVAAIRERDEIDGEWWLVAGGVLTILFGGILLAAPLLAGAVLIRTIGLFAILGGIALIIAAFRLRTFARSASTTA